NAECFQLYQDNKRLSESLQEWAAECLQLDKDNNRLTDELESVTHELNNHELNQKGIQQAITDGYELKIAHYKSLINILNKRAKDNIDKRSETIKALQKQLAIRRMIKHR
ncbi:MAG: hypothetical protein ACKPKO_49700, partial [Candidatus Fonsibacter sp.]